MWFLPSLITCACLYINLKSNLRLLKGFNEEKLFVTGYKINEIKDCLNVLLNALIEMENHNKLIKIWQKKYNS